jgi:hypothetical protein
MQVVDHQRRGVDDIDRRVDRVRSAEGDFFQLAEVLIALLFRPFVRVNDADVIRATARHPGIDRNTLARAKHAVVEAILSPLFVTDRRQVDVVDVLGGSVVDVDSRTLRLRVLRAGERRLARQRSQQA